MPKNKGKGGKNRRRGKNENDVLKRELVEKDGDNQAYAQVTKMLGNGRLMAFCFDGKSRLCHIRGKLRKKVWINTGDIILVGLREYQDDKADVILKYTPDEARFLKNQGQLPENAKLNEIGEEQNEGDVEFIDSGDKDFDENEVADQDRSYYISDLDSDSDEDDEESDEDEAHQKARQTRPQKKVQIVANESEEDETESEEESDDEDVLKYSAKDKRSKQIASSSDEDVDPELAAERGNYFKPGARDQKKRKGKRGK